MLKVTAIAAIAVIGWLAFVGYSAFGGLWMSPVVTEGDTEAFFEYAGSRRIPAHTRDPTPMPFLHWRMANSCYKKSSSKVFRTLPHRPLNQLIPHLSSSSVRIR
ncbi:MAG: hypothetical protein ABJN62_18445 [Halioglobus sp.]